MIIKKFRIKNYKSIIDSGDCYIQKDLTILAGKNESGKTSILEALNDFNLYTPMKDEVVPVQDDSAVPEISITFEASKEEIDQYYKLIHEYHLQVELEKEEEDDDDEYENEYENEEFEVDIKEFDNDTDEDNPHAVTNLNEVIAQNREAEKLTYKGNILEFELIKRFPERYEVSEKLKQLLCLEDTYCDFETTTLEERAKSVFDDISKIHKSYFKNYFVNPILLNFENIELVLSQITSYKNNVDMHSSAIPSKEKAKNLIQLSELTKLLNDYKLKSSGSLFPNWEILLELVPNFILFKDFDSQIPNKISFSDLEKSSFISDLELISNLEIDTIITGSDQKKVRHKNILNIKVNEDYSKFWSQDDAKISIDWDSSNLHLWIVEGEQYYAPSQRSKGKQWHITFYSRVTARANEKISNVILIDEPGMYLHAVAQDDIYKKLVENSINSQTIFTTHSPYLINGDELNRVRLVVKENNLIGTTIISKIHKSADKETLSPILTAIGLNLTKSLLHFDNTNSVIVEGQSDYYYLNAFKYILDKSNSFKVIFGGGAGKLGYVGTILTGWGSNVIYLFDFDKGKKEGCKTLKRDWGVGQDYILLISDKPSEAIEDLFAHNDFKKQVLDDENNSYTNSNSQYLKDSKIEKVLKAKLFYDKVLRDKTIELSKETKERFKELMEKIEGKFNS
jgi:predicted ATP-dependent endonuclease of OLD family